MAAMKTAKSAQQRRTEPPASMNTLLNGAFRTARPLLIERVFYKMLPVTSAVAI
jgi:hypothetical protein